MFVLFLFFSVSAFKNVIEEIFPKNQASKSNLLVVPKQEQSHILSLIFPKGLLVEEVIW